MTCLVVWFKPPFLSCEGFPALFVVLFVDNFLTVVQLGRIRHAVVRARMDGLTDVADEGK